MDLHSWSVEKIVAKLKALLTGKVAPDWKEQRYGRGALMEKPIAPFFLKGIIATK